jgi:hypothetical protein
MDDLRSAIEKAIGNQYEVLHLIGRGGMGAVYLARDRFLDRLVAVKILPDAGDATGRERFLREARTAARLTHPSIVPLHTFSQVDDTLLYVMGYVEGESLESLLTREGRLDTARAARIMSQIADALDHAHASGIVHRDVKPDNILIDRETGRAYLTDFGIARAGTGNTMTKTGMVLGTPHYMSPEQAAGDAIDGRSDLYSLGVIGYRMVSGRLPFDTGDVRELLMQQVSRDPAPLAVDETNAELAQAIMRSLEKAPANRWTRGAEIGSALQPRSRYDLRLPDDLEWMPANLTVATAIWVAADIVLFGVSLATGDREWPLMMVFGPLCTLPLLGLNAVVQARKFGIAWKRALAIAFMPPAKWTGWWPSALRRPGDVWHRLPKSVRFIRAAFTALNAVQGGVLLPFMMYIIKAAVSLKVPPGGSLSKAVIAIALGNVVSLLALVAATVPWGKRFSVSRSVQQRLLGAPTWNNAFWDRPDVAPLLASDAAVSVRPTDSGSAQDLLRQIEILAAEFPGPLARAARDAADAGADVARFLEHADGELKALDRDVDPAERDRVAEKIAALGTAPSPMRQLLSQQLSLHDELEERRRRLLDDRARGMALLRRVHLELTRSRAELAAGASSVETLSGQIRAACDDLLREREAHTEVEKLLETPTPR